MKKYRATIEFYLIRPHVISKRIDLMRIEFYVISFT